MAPADSRDSTTYGPGVDGVGPVAADGTAHFRFPGGRLRPRDWTELSRIAALHGSDLHLTSRGCLQIREVTDPVLFRNHVSAAGLSSSGTRSEDCHIIASPLAGLLDGRYELTDLIVRLDAALLARPLLSGLREHILFGLDDGSGDVLAHNPDLAATVRTGGTTTRIYFAGRDTGLGARAVDAPAVLIDAAEALARTVGGAPRPPLRAKNHDLVVLALSNHAMTWIDSDPATVTTTDMAPPVGWVDTLDGLVSLLAVLPHDVIPARTAEFLGAIDRPSTVSADRVIGLHGLTEGMAEQVVRVLAPMGLEFDAESPWSPSRRARTW